jgi:long-subunit fatty acid transport protein
MPSAAGRRGGGSSSPSRSRHSVRYRGPPRRPTRFFEGIGTVPRSMGGTALAYDVGGSALANNPATMLLMPAGQAAAFEINADSANTLDVRDLATGDVATTDRWPLFHAYYSPNLNYVWREGEFAAGIGLFSQGGLGTQYGHDSFLSRLPSGAATGLDVSSKALFLRAPLAAAYQVTPELAISGAFQGVFAGLSLSNLAGADQLATVISQGRASGSLLPGLAAITGATGGAYFSFWRSPEVQFGTDAFGISGRLGATYAFDDATRLGIDYQFRTLLPDLSGSTGRVVAVSPAGTQFSLPGSFRVLDFQLPADFGVGLSHAFTPDLLLAFDYHHTLWQGAFQALKIRSGCGRRRRGRHPPILSRYEYLLTRPAISRHARPRAASRRAGRQPAGFEQSAVGDRAGDHDRARLDRAQLRSHGKFGDQCRLYTRFRGKCRQSLSPECFGDRPDPSGAKPGQFQPRSRTALLDRFEVQYSDVNLTQALDFGSRCVAQLGAGTCASVFGLTPGNNDGRAHISANDFAFGYNLGLIVEPLHGSRLGFAYRSEVDHHYNSASERFDVPANARAFLDAAGLATALTGSQAYTDLPLPAPATFSLAQSLSADLTFLADATMTRWRVLRQTVITATDPTTGADVLIPQHYQNANRYAVGMNWAPREEAYELRAGFAYDQTPIPTAFVQAALPDRNRVYITFGGSYRITNNIAFDVGLALTQYLGPVPINRATVNGDQLRGSFYVGGEIVAAQLKFEF